MKQSNYNLFFEHNYDSNKLIAYNSRTNALATISLRQYEEYLAFDEQLMKNVQLIIDLKKGGFVIDKDIDELKLIQFTLLNSRYSSSSLGLTIAPTLDCNFECIYCYEKGKQHGYMTGDVQEAIVTLVEEQIRRVSSVSITWYGGEPTLAMGIIENISAKLMQLCKDANKLYSSGIVTNGYNVSRNNVVKLKDLGVNFIQVTVDGTEEVHNSRRPLKGGGPTFWKVLHNLRNCKELLPRTSLRVNVDKENVETFPKILDIIQKLGIDDAVSIYPGYVEPINDCYSQDTCLEFSEFSNLVYNFDNVLLNEGIIPSLMHKYPRLLGNICGADANNSFVIDPKGNLYKCWSDIGRDEHKVGNLLEPSVNNVNVFLGYMLYDPTLDAECKECNLLPICMGGCPRRRIDKNVDRCSEYRYVLKDYLRQIAYYKSSEVLKG